MNTRRKPLREIPLLTTRAAMDAMHGPAGSSSSSMSCAQAIGQHMVLHPAACLGSGRTPTLHFDEGWSRSDELRTTCWYRWWATTCW